MNYLIFGAGLQGAAIAHDILNHDAAHITIIDSDENRAQAVVQQLNQQFTQH
ncbi:hypothetical protein D6789_00725 [Candidatus Woesearchaeota archaeon]|nr:MAG: hypothetical protein D6789_00725 [Candidatus Woesearchaeota archaeon]